MTVTTAYLGDEYSHSYAAAASLGGELRQYPSIQAALNAVADGAVDSAVVPIENNLEGSVRETLDGLHALTLYIRAETTIPVCQNLIGLAGADADKITRVYSHPQALAQCRTFLEQLGVEQIAVSSTSAGMDRIKTPTDGAIARTPKPGQAVLREGVASGENFTRFVRVMRTPTFAGDKVSVVFGTKNEPGALLGALEVLRDYGLNMSRIESRPDKCGMGRYIFFVDFLFGGDKTRLMSVFDKLSGSTTFVKFLGQYGTEAN